MGFVEVNQTNLLKLRVYERGSGETQACGSGACAAMVACKQQGWVNDITSVELVGGTLVISWEGNNEPVYMKGDASHVYEGEISLY